MFLLSKKSLYPFYLTLLILFPFLLFNKGSIVLYINNFHNPLLDIFFKNMSRFGNGLFIIICFLCLLLFFNIKWIYKFTLAALIHLILVHSCKQFFFKDRMRPYRYFDCDPDGILNLVENVKIYYRDTFPSGHTTTIFFLFTFFALYLNNRKLSFILCLVGFTVGISRIYLIQHFFVDVYFGMLFGVSSSLLASYIVSLKPKQWYNKKVLSYILLPKIKTTNIRWGDKVFRIF
ncbi:phosphatase PAP2 family protein [Abyssalbus ytuae]|uniref:phosphatase PAP2 family protein n=1 Tax=Abyssalbus ytuae TaxID=2926907 RepID=UPI0034E2CA52